MKRSASVIFVSGLALALAGCGGEAQNRKHDSKGGGAPFGLELAMAAASQSEMPPVLELAPDEVADELERGSIRLIDIRTASELAEDTSIPGAEHIPMDELDASVLDNSDGREVVLYCRSGKRSQLAATKLAEQSGKAVTHMPGGILAWQERVRLAAACEEGGGQTC